MIRHNYLQGFLFTACILYCSQAVAQKVKKETPSRSATAFKFSYTYHIPGGDLKERFGNSSALGFGMLHKLKNNWMFTADAQFIFGGTIKDSTLLDGLKTTNGFILNSSGQFATVRLFERGYAIFLSAGKLIPIKTLNKNSGLLLKAGGGFIQHKIRIDDVGGLTPSLNTEYKKGYDRLTNGFALNEFIGYMRMDKYNLLNFYIGVDFIQGFTKNRRDFNFDTRTRDDKRRYDLTYGIQAGIMIAIYHSSTDDEFFYK